MDTSQLDASNGRAIKLRRRCQGLLAQCRLQSLMPYFVAQGSKQHEVLGRAHAGIMLAISCTFSGDYATIKCGDYAT